MDKKRDDPREAEIGLPLTLSLVVIGSTEASKPWGNSPTELPNLSVQRIHRGSSSSARDKDIGKRAANDVRGSSGTVDDDDTLKTVSAHKSEARTKAQSATKAQSGTRTEMDDRAYNKNLGSKGKGKDLA